ncbi:2TM domain-containing protein [Colwellia sp. UCD-KL20]|uniref:2TM domain-containing protein n=1 Tax=Colwellia sp. UCD-KL20 TaxID=1917165 RepID=UPI000970A5FD
MIVRKLRLQQGWSQEQLSEFSGLSIRTIQRIERGQNASVESLKSLAAVFEVEITDLTQEKDMNNDTAQPQLAAGHASISYEEECAIKHVKDIKDFYSHLVTYVCVIVGLFLVNMYTNPNHIWFIWTAIFWGIGIVSHGLSVFEVFNFFSPNWEKKQIEKRLGRKL